MNHSITLAACGLDAPGWDLAYFPEDMPEDWRLAYYANEYPILLLPASIWSQDPDLEAWLEDVHEDFGFYCMASDALSDSELQRLIDAAGILGTRLRGLIIEAGDAVAYGDLFDRLAGILAGVQVAVMSPYRDYPLCWQVDTAEGTRCGPGLLQIGGEATPRELREYLERYAAATDSSDPVLFVKAPYAVFETLRDLIALMGL